jgi:drug/metabolite transporter (DMT)-like permease
MATIWGINFSVVKYGTRIVSPLAFNGLRVAIAAIVLLAVALIAREGWPDRRTTWTLLGLGVIGNGLYQIFFIEGVARTQAGAASLVLAASPAFVALIGRVRGVERTGPRRLAGIALSLGGMALVIFGSRESAPGAPATLLGNLLVLAGCLCWSFFTVLLKPYTERASGTQISALTMVGGAVPLLVVSAGAIGSTSWDSLPLSGWGAVFYSAIFALVVAYFCWYHGVRVLGPTRTAMYGNLQPVIALLVAWAMLGEVPTMSQVVGAAAILAGLLLTRA